MQLRKLLTVMESVLRRCAGAARLEPGDVLALGDLADNPASIGADVARRTGRARQHVQRTLHRLARRGLVSHFTQFLGRRRRALVWVLTEAGGALWSDTSRRLVAWERLLAEHLDLAELEAQATAALDALQTRARRHGYGDGLRRPSESWLDPHWEHGAAAPLSFEQRLADPRLGFTPAEPLSDEELDSASFARPPHDGPRRAIRPPGCSTPPRRRAPLREAPPLLEPTHDTPAPLEPSKPTDDTELELDPDDPWAHLGPPADELEAEWRRIWGG